MKKFNSIILIVMLLLSALFSFVFVETVGAAAPTVTTNAAISIRYVA